MSIYSSQLSAFYFTQFSNLYTLKVREQFGTNIKQNLIINLYNHHHLVATYHLLQYCLLTPSIFVEQLNLAISKTHSLKTISNGYNMTAKNQH